MTKKEWYESQELIFQLVEPMTIQGMKDLIMSLENVISEKKGS